jgi:serine/threonine protein kinase
MGGNPMDPYKSLEVDPKACQQVIRAAHKALIDVHGTCPARVKQLDDARDLLLDQDRRDEYDGTIDAFDKGKVIEGYRIDERITEGGFGTTYLGTHILSGCPVCIKHALRVSASDEAILLDEVRICWDLRHWGIPAMRDVIRMPDDSLAIVMSFVPGPTLTQIREMPEYENGIDPEHLSWIIDRTLNILKYLHMHGVVHGDIKPPNMIIQPESHDVTLVDYGLSLLKPRGVDSAKGYTPDYASPEHLDGLPLIPESDFYCLGKTMIFALGGDPRQVKVPGATPPAICDFIKELIRRDPDQRPSWDREDLCETIQDVRMKAFGRSMSNMKKL